MGLTPGWADYYKSTPSRAEHRDRGLPEVATESSRWRTRPRCFGRRPPTTTRRGPTWNSLLTSTAFGTQWSAKSGRPLGRAVPDRSWVAYPVWANTCQSAPPRAERNHRESPPRSLPDGPWRGDRTAHERRPTLTIRGPAMKLKPFLVAASSVAIVGVGTPAVAAELSNANGQTCEHVGVWHFVNNQTGGAAPGSLSATFSDEPVGGGPQQGHQVHFSTSMSSRPDTAECQHRHAARQTGAVGLHLRRTTKRSRSSGSQAASDQRQRDRRLVVSNDRLHHQLDEAAPVSGDLGGTVSSDTRALAGRCRDSLVGGVSRSGGSTPLPGPR